MCVYICIYRHIHIDQYAQNTHIVTHTRKSTCTHTHACIYTCTYTIVGELDNPFSASLIPLHENVLGLEIVMHDLLQKQT